MTMTREEFSEHILPLKNKVFRLSISYMKCEDQARDVVQDVLMRFWENRMAADAIRKPEAWLMTMTKNRCLDLLKRKGRRYDEISADYTISDSSYTPDVATEHTEKVKKLREVINSLPDSQQKVIRLRDLDGMSYQEIVDETGMDLNLVKVTIHRARKAVKNTIEKIYAYGLE
ncbi:MAG: RNA polymerase sigma factor (sigma-70 family) [Flavobacteriales bacterium]